MRGQAGRRRAAVLFWTTPRLTPCTSDLRQVPDTQEVFVFGDSDASIIFEILEIVREGRAGEDLREAVR